MPDFSKILFAKSQQGRAVDLCIAADVVLNARMERDSVLVVPGFLGLILRFEKHCTRIPVVFFSRQVVAAFQKQNAFAGWSEMVGERSATGSRADDDDVKMILLRHPCHLSWNTTLGLAISWDGRTEHKEGILYSLISTM